MTTHILPFTRRRIVSARSRPLLGPAQIIIFPGVRYERTAAKNGPVDQKPRDPSRGPSSEGARRKG